MTTKTETNPSPQELAKSVATFLRERASEAICYDLPEVSAGFESMAANVDAVAAGFLSLTAENERLRAEMGGCKRRVAELEARLAKHEQPGYGISHPLSAPDKTTDPVPGPPKRARPNVVWSQHPGPVG